MKETILIQNLKCQGCASSITRALKTFPELESVSVDLENAEVTLESSGPLRSEQYKAALRDAGYPPTGEKNTLGRKAKSYVSCAIGRIQD